MSQPPPIYCSACGKQNAPDAKFCNECARPIFFAPPVQPTPAQNKPYASSDFADWIKSWWAKQTANDRLVLYAVAFITLMVVVALISGERFPKQSESSSTKPSTVTTPTPPPARTELNAAVRFTGTQFVITNNESVDLTNIKMEINGGIFSGGYQLTHGTMKAKETYTVGAMQFADSDGKRFNPFQMKPQKFTISADSSIGHLFYVGGWN